MHHAILSVGHQSDQVLVGGDTEGQRQQLVLERVGAQRTLKVVGRTVLQAEAKEKVRLDSEIFVDVNDRYFICPCRKTSLQHNQKAFPHNIRVTHRHPQIRTHTSHLATD